MIPWCTDTIKLVKFSFSKTKTKGDLVWSSNLIEICTELVLPAMAETQNRNKKRKNNEEKSNRICHFRALVFVRVQL